MRALDLVLSAAAEVFRRPVRAEDDFFEVGGDSVSAVELLALLEERAGCELELEVLFDAGSFADLADRLPLADRTG